MSTRASRENPGRADIHAMRARFGIDRQKPYRREDPRKDHAADRPHESPHLRGLRSALKQRGR